MVADCSGISEVQIIQWYVEEGARIEEWSPLCQYQSDKAVDDITSRYEGVVTKLHVQADDTVETGKPLCDIEVDNGVSEENGTPPAEPRQEEKAANVSSLKEQESSGQEGVKEQPSRHQTLATPAVRALLKQSNTDILDVQGTGKHGRVLKEDVLRHLSSTNEDGSKATKTNPAPRSSPYLGAQPRPPVSY
ncbi:hypothetical protein KEM55_004377 [Ascosphaera atra]|nr:hypothetical protein KEM55_004377 [Ascosphaera atra]